MRRRGICILLAFVLAMSTACAVSLAATDEPDVSASTSEDAAPDVEKDTGALDSAASETPEPIPTTIPDAANLQDEAASSAPSARDANDPDDEGDGGIGSGLPSNAAPYAPSDDGETDIDITIIGDGVLEVLEDGAAVSVSDWEQEAEYPAEDVEFLAVPDDDSDALTGVAVNGELIDFDRTPDDEGAYHFTVPEVDRETEITVSFGNTIPAYIIVYGPGSMSILEDGVWTALDDESDAPAFEGQVGETVRLRATSTQSGYYATYLSTQAGSVEPVAYGPNGAEFEVVVTGPEMTIGARFLETATLDIEIEGEGTVIYHYGEQPIELHTGAKLPFETDSVFGEDALSFTARPAAGYQILDVRYASYPVILTEETDEAAESAQPSASPSADGGASGVNTIYSFSIPDPSDGALLRVTFLANSDSTIEWLRGSDTTTGISWAIPLGDTVYGVSNVTDGSNIVITPLTQGTAYEQARTVAARFGSAFVAWDFTLVNAQGVSYAPTVPVLFSLPIPSGYPQSAQSLRMLHVLSDGQLMENPIEIRTDSATGMNYIYMRVDSLSTFILVNAASGATSPTAVPTYAATPVPTAPVAVAGATAAPTTAPGTDDSSASALWWFVCIAAAFVCALCLAQVRRLSRQ